MGLVEYEVRDRIAYLTLNRPAKLNALTNSGIEDIAVALERFDDDDDAQVGILSGRGRAFSTGADVVERLALATAKSDGRPHFTNEAGAFLDTRSWKPLVAAVHGYVLGHALMTAFLCDIVIAAAGTRFQVTETAWGVPAAGGMGSRAQGRRLCAPPSRSGAGVSAAPHRGEGVGDRHALGHRRLCRQGQSVHRRPLAC